MNIADIDPNFKINDSSYEGITFHDPTVLPMKIYGVFKDTDDKYCRLPMTEALKITPNIGILSRHTAGGRIRFKTNSSRFHLRYYAESVDLGMNMSLAGSSSFDLYRDGNYCSFFSFDYEKAKTDCKTGIDSEIKFSDNNMKNIEIYFPAYDGVNNVFVGLDNDAIIEQADDYLFNEIPIVYYGSSITQGGCCSHPGNTYESMISRKLNCNFINLGFSGNCFGEERFADYIASIPMKAFVYDYDHNAANAEMLMETHNKFYKRFREFQPDVPIIIVSVADKVFGDTVEARKKAIYKTFKEALDNGDKNVYFIDGQTIYQNVGYELCTVDTCHPNDLGFWCMANVIGDKLKSILNL